MLDCYRNAVEIQSLWQAGGPVPDARKAALARTFDMTARAFFQYGLPEFDDAVSRFKAMSGRRFGYPEIAQHASRIAGRGVAISFVKFGAQVAQCFRSLRRGRS